MEAYPKLVRPVRRQKISRKPDETLTAVKEPRMEIKEPFLPLQGPR